MVYRKRYPSLWRLRRKLQRGKHRLNPADAETPQTPPVEAPAFIPVKAETPAEATSARYSKRMASTTHKSLDWVGQSVKRKEDARLVRGKGKFVDDIKLLGMLHLVFVRSPYAHAVVTSVDVSEAEAVPGVVCTLTGAEISKLIDPFFEIGPAPSNRILDYPMAVDRVRYQGEPVAAVIAKTPPSL